MRGWVLILLTIIVLPLVSADITSWNITALANNTYTNDTKPDFTFEAVSNNATSFTCELFINDTGYGKNTSVQNNTQTTITANSTLSEGNYNWYINCTDNTTTKSEIRVFTIDTTYPSISYVSPPSNGDAYQDITITIQYSDVNLNYCRLVWDNVAETFDNSNSTHMWETKYLEQGQQYTFNTYCIDKAGQKNTTSTITIFGKQASGGGGGAGVISTVPIRITTAPQVVDLIIYDEAGNIIYRGVYKSGNYIQLPFGSYKVVITSGDITTTEYINVDRSKSFHFELGQSPTPTSNINVIVAILFLAGIGYLFLKRG